jgi:hypothetical protein
MSIFAVVENNIVTNIVAGEDRVLMEIILPDALLVEETDATNVAWIGSEIIDGKFKPWPPYGSWNFDLKSFSWNPPVKMPDDGTPYAWNEEAKEWRIIEYDETR